jgi:hypothetical protein
MVSTHRCIFDGNALNPAGEKAGVFFNSVFSKFWPVLANCFTIRPVIHTFADRGRPSDQETVYLQWF